MIRFWADRIGPEAKEECCICFSLEWNWLTSHLSSLTFVDWDLKLLKLMTDTQVRFAALTCSMKLISISRDMQAQVNGQFASVINCQTQGIYNLWSKLTLELSHQRINFQDESYMSSQVSVYYIIAIVDSSHHQWLLCIVQFVNYFVTGSKIVSAL